MKHRDADAASEQLLIQLQAENIRLRRELAERRQASDDPPRSGDHLVASLFDGIATPLFIVERDTLGRFWYIGANSAYLRTMGFEGRQVIGRQLVEFVPEGQIDAVCRTFSRVLDEQVVITEEQHLPWSPLAPWWLRVLTPLRDSDGRSRRLVGTRINITEQKLAEAARRESEERYRWIADHSSDLVCVLDTESRFLYASPSYLALLGHDPAALVGSLAEDLLHPEDRAVAVTTFSRERPYETMQLTLRARNAGGEWRWLDARGTAIVREGREFFVIASRDVTEQRQLGEQLLQAQKMEAIGRLAGGVAHDFNNLLIAIGASAELAATQLDAEHTAQAELAEIIHATSRGADLTRQLLTFARQQPTELRPTSMGELLSRLETLLRRLIRADIALATQLDSELWSASADASQIEQVLINLVLNARDAMPRGGSMTVSVRNAALAAGGLAERAGVPPGEYVLLEIADTGVGMDDATQARLFEPFFTTKPAGQGSGLGLATSYGIIRQHGGGIAVSSAPMSGTSVTLLLPRAAGGAAERPADAPLRADLPQGSETILLVEDTPAVRFLTTRLLERLGYSVLQAGDGEEALAQINATREGPIHLMITDVVMPNMSGVDLARRVGQVRPGLRVLITSGYHAESSDLDQLGGVIAAYLPKPYSVAQLAQQVRELLDYEGRSAGVTA